MTAAASPVAAETRLSHWLELTKFRISAVSTLTATTGFIAYQRGVRSGLIGATLGTLLMAMASSALNEVQEREIDARMARTRNRPIPSGIFSPVTALGVVLLLASAGYSILYLTGGLVPALLGLLAMGWYNGIYTPLKRMTAFAVVPGSVIGAIPPAIGWAAAGGEVNSPALLALCFVFFIWQVPHFWLLALRHNNDYAAAGLPTLSKHFSPQQIFRLIFTWTAASVAASALLVVFQTIKSPVTAVTVGAVGIWLLWRYRFMLSAAEKSRRIFIAFMDINKYAMVLMAAVIVDAFLVR
jgi:heme o synthase